MPSGRRLPFPVPPDLPSRFEPAPTSLESHDTWDGVAADGHTGVADVVTGVQLREVTWTDAQLVSRHFGGLMCKDVRFVRADLAGVVLEDCSFNQVVFESCRMSGAVFAGSTLLDVELVDCVADLADFRMATIRRSAARDTVLRTADFYGCGLTDVRLGDCDLTGANFEAAIAERLDLRGSTVDGLRGVSGLGGAHIDAVQVLPLGAALIGSLGFRVD